MDVIARARAHVERGQVRAAIELLKPRAGGERAPYEARRALAQLYRDRGAPDQAGRWGIVIEGWTTPVERDRLARALVSYRDPRSFLLLPADAPEPADLAAVLELRAQHSQRSDKRFREAAEGFAASPAGRAARREEVIWGTAIVLLLLGALGPAVAVLLERVLVHDRFALLAGAAGWTLMALAALLLATGRWLEGRRPRLGHSAWIAVVLAGVATGCFVLAEHWGAP